MSTWLSRFKPRRAEHGIDINAPLLSSDEIALLVEQARALVQRRKQQHDVHQRHPGDSRSVHMGRGLDFEESRPYQPGDDIRDMDWRTTARIGKPYLKVYREEHHPMLHVVLDRTASMRFGTRVQLKATQAARAATLLAVTASQDCACIGGTLVAEQAVPLVCQPGNAGALALARAAAAPCPPLPDAGDAAAPWGGLLPRLIAEIPRGSRIVFISDLRWLREAHAPALSLLASQQEVAVAEIVDPVEIELPNVGLAHFRDANTQATRWIDTASRAVRAAFQHEAAALRQAQSRWLRRAGIAHISIRTDESAADRIAEFSFHG
jgi:uncharacterized protein (DUF58 family)